MVPDEDEESDPEENENSDEAVPSLEVHNPSNYPG